LVATLTGLILAALVNRDPPAWTVVWVYLLVFAVVVLVRLWTFGGLGLATLLKQRGLQAAGAVFAVGVVGAVVQFLYSSVYVPATATPALAVETKFKASKPEAGRVPVTATVTFTNTTKHPVNVLGTMYTIYGAKMEPHDLDDKSVQDGEELLRRPAHLRAGRARVYARDGTWRAIEGGTVFPAGTFAEPGERLSDQLVAFVPRDMDVASLLVEAVVARRRFQDLDEERTSIVEDRDGSVIHRSLRIKDPSWLHSLTRRTRYVNVLQAFRNEPLPGCAGRYLAVFIASEPWAPTLLGEEGCGSHAAHMRDHYGITPLSARTEIRLEG
jgi:hypothetical protein